MHQKVVITGGVLLCEIGLRVGLMAANSEGDLSASVATNAVHQMPPIIVTATRTEEEPFRLPYTVDEVGRRGLEQNLPRTLPEALKETPSVMVQKTGHGQGSPFIRGFTGFRTLMLIDGIRLNNSVFRDGPNQYWNTVDVMSVNRLEVVKGPSSVLYGSDAIGGTVNAITSRREEFGPGENWDRRTYYRFASAENSHTARAEVSGNFNEEVGVLVGGTFKDYGDLRGGRDVGRQPQTGYSEYDWDVKLERFLDPDSKVVVAHQTVRQDDAWRTHRTIYGLLWEGTTRGTDRKLAYDQDRDLTYLQYHTENLSGVIDEMHFSMSHQLQGEQEHRIRSNGTQQKQGFDVHTFGSFLTLHSSSPVGEWVYGVEGYHDSVDSFSQQYNAGGGLTATDIQGPVGDDASYDLAGVFVQDKVTVGERVEFILGGRYTYVRAEANRVRDPITTAVTNVGDDWNAAVGSARLLWQVDQADHWHLFAGVSQGFRAPNLSDLTRFDIAGSGEVETAAPNLDPEYFITYEAGLKFDHERVSGQVAYYYTDIDSMIIRTPTGNVIGGLNEVTKRNSGDGYIHGVELSGEFELYPQWTARGAFTWMEGEVDGYPTSATVEQKEPVSKLMPMALQLGLVWEHPSHKYWVEAFCTLADKQDKLSAADRRDTQRIPPGGTPGYGIGTLRFGWNACGNARFVFAIENITDKDYRVHGSGLNEPGRNFVISADIRF
jgi:hemoglobin/transferrin/lactoferrin receptor protein